MSEIKKLEFSVTNDFGVGTVASMQVVYNKQLHNPEQQQHPYQSFSFSVVIDNDITNHSVTITSEKAQKLAIQTAIKMLEDFATSQDIMLETNHDSNQADQ